MRPRDEAEGTFEMGQRDDLHSIRINFSFHHSYQAFHNKRAASAETSNTNNNALPTPDLQSAGHLSLRSRLPILQIWDAAGVTSALNRLLIQLPLSS